jgi:hypothetical protein
MMNKYMLCEIHWTKVPADECMQVDDGAAVLGIFSGASLPPPALSDTGRLRLTLTSDASIQGRGFVASYRADAERQARALQGWAHKRAHACMHA